MEKVNWTKIMRSDKVLTRIGEKNLMMVNHENILDGFRIICYVRIDCSKENSIRKWKQRKKIRSVSNVTLLKGNLTM